MPACGLPVGLQEQPGSKSNAFKGSVLFVVIERAGGGIVSYVDIRPAVIIKISRKHSQAIGAARAKNSRRLGNIRKSAVAIVVVKDVSSPLQTRRPARHQHTLVKTR